MFSTVSVTAVVLPSLLVFDASSTLSSFLAALSSATFSFLSVDSTPVLSVFSSVDSAPVFSVFSLPFLAAPEIFIPICAKEAAVVNEKPTVFKMFSKSPASSPNACLIRVLP